MSKSSYEDRLAIGVGEDGVAFPVGETLEPARAVEVASAMLARLVAGSDHEARVLALRPYPGDYARVFTERAAARAEAVYEAMWADLPGVPRGAPEALRVVASTSDLLAGFPAEYDAVRGFLRPGHIWVCAWLGEVLIDGLVYRSRRWAWFPRPWQALDAGALGHWAI